MHVFASLVAVLALAVPSLAAVQVTTPATATSYPQYEATGDRVILRLVDHYDIIGETGVDAEGLAEYLYYDKDQHRVWVVNSELEQVDIYSLDADAKLSSYGTLHVDGTPNSVVYNSRDKVFAVAVAANPQTDPGFLMIVDAETLSIISNVTTANPLPDHVSFGPDYACLYSANEGEPAGDVDVDLVNPYGGVTQVCSSDFSDPTTYKVSHSDLEDLTITEVPAGAHDPSDPTDSTKTIDAFISYLEPEFITYSEADEAGDYEIYVICQEANLFLVYEGNTASTPDLTTEPVRIMPLGFKDHSLANNTIDIEEDDVVDLTTYKGLKGIYQPDTVKAVTQGGKTYIVTANEGDVTAVEEERDIRIEDMTFVDGALDDPYPTAFDGLKELSVGQKDAEGKYDGIYMNGGRSFSVMDASTGELVFDSGDQLAKMILEYAAPFFNANDGELGVEDRSENKGSEVEALAVAEVGGYKLLFVGLERPGLVAVVDITDVTKPEFHSFNAVIDSCSDTQAKMVDPEAIQFVSAEDSPSGQNLLIVSGAVSSSITVFEVVMTDGLTDANAVDVCERAANGDPAVKTLDDDETFAPTFSETPSSAMSLGAPILASVAAALLAVRT